MRIKISIDERVCFDCGNSETYIMPNGCKMWYNVYSKPCCNRCYAKHRIRYKDKHIICKDKNMDNQCYECGKKVGDTYINKKGEKKTIKYITTHHDEYIDSDPLANSKPICISCHNSKGKPRKNPQRMDNKLEVCPKCNSTNIVKYGVEHLATKILQKYKCKDCGRYSY